MRFQVSNPSRMFVLLSSQDLKQLARTLCCASEFAGAQTRILKWGPRVGQNQRIIGGSAQQRPVVSTIVLKGNNRVSI